MSDYPEHDKMAANRIDIDAVTAFQKLAEEKDAMLATIRNQNQGP